MVSLLILCPSVLTFIYGCISSLSHFFLSGSSLSHLLGLVLFGPKMAGSGRNDAPGVDLTPAHDGICLRLDHHTGVNTRGRKKERNPRLTRAHAKVEELPNGLAGLVLHDQ
jgi:hypothetical protein